MRMRDLECFVGVCEVGSINQAAVLLHIAQPALGLIVRKLEDELGARLLVRHARGVRPTPQGEEVRAWAVEVLEGRRCILRRLRLSGAAKYFLRMGLSPSAAALLAGKMSAESWIPGASVCVLEEASHVLVSSVASSVLDLALSFETPGSEALHSDPLLHQALYLVGGPGAFEDRPTITFAEAMERELTMGAMPASVRYVVESEARRLGVGVNVRFELESVGLVKAFVGHGVGAAILPFSCVANEVATGALSASRIVEPEVMRTLSLVRRAGGAEAEEQEWTGAPLVDCIRRALPELLPMGVEPLHR
jgi:LysR family nitrogen assimilation transcriptional regulator